jgi:hypothetical protein
MSRSVLALGAALLMFGANAAVAQERAKACVADVKKLCADVEPGEGRVAGCIKQHLNELSEPCQNLVAEVATAAKACTADVKGKCADARRKVAKVACLKSALTNLSDACKSAISQIGAGRK